MKIYFVSEVKLGNYESRQGRRERGGQGGWGAGPPTISWTKKNFFHVKSESIKFSQNFYMEITCETLFIEQDISDKKEIAFSEFVVLTGN